MFGGAAGTAAGGDRGMFVGSAGAVVGRPGAGGQVVLRAGGGGVPVGAAGWSSRGLLPSSWDGPATGRKYTGMPASLRSR